MTSNDGAGGIEAYRCPSISAVSREIRFQKYTICPGAENTSVPSRSRICREKMRRLSAPITRRFLACLSYQIRSVCDGSGHERCEASRSPSWIRLITDPTPIRASSGW